MSSIEDLYAELAKAAKAFGQLDGINNRLLDENTFLRASVKAKLAATVPPEDGRSQQLKAQIPLLKDALDSLSHNCGSDERDGALYNLSAVIAVLEAV